MNAVDESPPDLAAVQSDDALLDMLGSAVVVTDDDLSRVLYAWRRDVDAEPFPGLVPADVAVALVETAKPKTFVGRVVDAIRYLLGGRR